MWAWRCEQWGGPEKLVWRELPDPEPGRRQVRVAIEAAGLNFLDTLIIQGRYQVRPELPFTPGVEFCGRVVAQGPDATLAIGTRVTGTVSTGAFATDLIADERLLVPVPDSVPAAQLAAVPIVYPTAYLAVVKQGQLTPGEVVLVTAAAGGVGLAAVQLARHAGARVIGAASGGKHELLRAQGCEHVVDYREAEWGRALKGWLRERGLSGVDLVVDMVGGSVAVEALKLLNWAGRLMVVGFASGEVASLPANLLLLKQARAEGVYWGGAADRDPKAAMRVAAELYALMQQHQLLPQVSRVLPMHDLPALLLQMGQRETTGKVVVVND